MGWFNPFKESFNGEDIVAFAKSMNNAVETLKKDERVAISRSDLTEGDMDPITRFDIDEFKIIQYIIENETDIQKEPSLDILNKLKDGLEKLKKIPDDMVTSIELKFKFQNDMKQMLDEILKNIDTVIKSKSKGGKRSSRRKSKKSKKSKKPKKKSLKRRRRTPKK